MSINNPDAYVASLWNWGFLDDCFLGTRIRVSDIDGIVERNGYFLVFETKGDGVMVPLGQQILLDRMVRTGLYTVMIIWGEPNNPTTLRLYNKTSDKFYENVSLATIQDLTTEWFEWANEQEVK